MDEASHLFSSCSMPLPDAFILYYPAQSDHPESEKQHGAGFGTLLHGFGAAMRKQKTGTRTKQKHSGANSGTDRFSGPIHLLFISSQLALQRSNSFRQPS